jgi:hypothetical protein
MFINERKENSDFMEFYTYVTERVHPDDIFIFPPKKYDHLPNTMAYLFPGYVQIRAVEGSFEKMLFGKNAVEYIDLANTIFHEQKAWIIITEIDFAIPPDIDAEFQGNFGWGFYRFKLYYTKATHALDVLAGQ